MQLPLLKCHGSDNDFIIIDELFEDITLTEAQRVEIAVQLSDRKRIVGSDGILFVQKSEHADAKMRMLNSDGSEAEMCGNGLRCVARYVIERLDSKELVIETMKADLPVAQVDNLFDDVETFEVAIEPVSLTPSTLPLLVEKNTVVEEVLSELDESLTFTALSVPNPHLVTVVPEVRDDVAKQIGEKANELKTLLPNGTNVSFMKQVADQMVYVRTFERGVGLTNACGTAMSASSLVACLLEMVSFDKPITVLNPGGMVQTLVTQDSHGQYFIKLRGNATYEFAAVVDIDFDDKEQTVLLEQDVFEEEALKYEGLRQAAKELAVG
ncbi:diaminopimelate epimerase [Paenalkalicoccus suaedae]|uniref:Diaminopimelate epimerase n=1 Tax=Paenalkalicoccus suaedae TaxID=2592382 RepID=A0A859FDB4_9BACI|nr:diaminopimelate epimerase [Paenalkalicoccus suaedae]QKS70811.1 diaminopimelate epimerase [Paenalkalicoccus suaedae]